MNSPITPGKWLRRPIFICLLFGLVSATGLVVIERLGIPQSLELRAFDRLLFLHPAISIDNRIVLINETEEDIRRFGHPLSDLLLANALRALEKAGPRVVGVDKYRDKSVAPGTDQLNAVLEQYQNIVWIYLVGDARENFVHPPPVLANQLERIGFNDVLNDPDGVTRRGLLSMDFDDKPAYYSFSLLLALRYLADENIRAQADSKGSLSLNGISLPRMTPRFGAYKDNNIDFRGYQIILDYPGLPTPFKVFKLADLLDGRIAKDVLRDKIVLIGSTAISGNDFRLLPGEIRGFGIDYHAYLTSQLLNAATRHRAPLADWPEYAEYAWMLTWCITGALLGLRRGRLRYLLALIAGECLLLLLCDYVFFIVGWWIPVVTPLFGWASALGLSVLYFSVRARLERYQIMRLFACHVSPEVATKLWEAREQFLNEGRVRPDVLTATVLFTDICNFTTVAENMEPLILMEWLNEYMDEMSRIVIGHGGVINKYIGDAIMAIFGVPVKRETDDEIASDARRAVQCALRFNSHLVKLNRHWQTQGLPAITMRVGIYTGLLVAGSFGGGGRMEYTVLGDTVNIASRLESFDKTISPPNSENPCRILIGESTFNYIRDHFRTQIVGECQLKGKNKPISIYEILSRELEEHSN